MLPRSWRVENDCCLPISRTDLDALSQSAPMGGATQSPVFEWQGAMRDARDAFESAWQKEPGSSRAAAAAIAAMRERLEHHIANWEALDRPDAHAPPTTERALSDVASFADGLRVIALPELRERHTDTALELLRRAVAESVDLEMLNDFAVLLHAALKFEDARAVLLTILYVDPERTDARENLEAMIGASE
jgi:hypothetical protein